MEVLTQLSYPWKCSNSKRRRIYDQQFQSMYINTVMFIKLKNEEYLFVVAFQETQLQKPQHYRLGPLGCQVLYNDDTENTAVET